MGWWTDPIGGSSKGAKRAPAKSKPKTAPERGKVIATTKQPARCQVCGKTARQCTCHQRGEAIPTRRGQPRDRVDGDGRIWCGVCGALTHRGVCMDVTCSTRRATS